MLLILLVFLGAAGGGTGIQSGTEMTSEKGGVSVLINRFAEDVLVSNGVNHC